MLHGVLVLIKVKFVMVVAQAVCPHLLIQLLLFQDRHRQNQDHMPLVVKHPWDQELHYMQLDIMGVRLHHLPCLELDQAGL